MNSRLFRHQYHNELVRSCVHRSVSYTHLDVYKRQDYIHSFSAVMQQSFRFAVFPKQYITFNPMQLSLIHIFAYFGLDPSVKQSGKFEGTKVQMSERGSAIARSVIHTLALQSISISRDVYKRQHIY